MQSLWNRKEKLDKGSLFYLLPKLVHFFLLNFPTIHISEIQVHKANVFFLFQIICLVFLLIFYFDKYIIKIIKLLAWYKFNIFVSMCSYEALHWHRLDTSYIIDMFCSKWNSYHLSHDRYRIRCDIALWNPFWQLKNDSIYVSLT